MVLGPTCCGYTSSAICWPASVLRRLSLVPVATARTVENAVPVPTPLTDILEAGVTGSSGDAGDVTIVMADDVSVEPPDVTFFHVTGAPFSFSLSDVKCTAWR